MLVGSTATKPCISVIISLASILVACAQFGPPGTYESNSKTDTAPAAATNGQTSSAHVMSSPVLSSSLAQYEAPAYSANSWNSAKSAGLRAALAMFCFSLQAMYLVTDSYNTRRS